MDAGWHFKFKAKNKGRCVGVILALGWWYHWVCVGTSRPPQKLPSFFPLGFFPWAGQLRLKGQPVCPTGALGIPPVRSAQYPLPLVYGR